MVLDEAAGFSISLMEPLLPEGWLRGNRSWVGMKDARLEAGMVKEEPGVASVWICAEVARLEGSEKVGLKGEANRLDEAWDSKIHPTLGKLALPLVGKAAL